jgi:hypothetical protein
MMSITKHLMLPHADFRTGSVRFQTVARTVAAGFLPHFQIVESRGFVKRAVPRRRNMRAASDCVTKFQGSEIRCFRSTSNGASGDSPRNRMTTRAQKLFKLGQRFCNPRHLENRHARRYERICLP